jgi:ubiquinone/menaquinone biosynthesis C-methylase UbiE
VDPGFKERVTVTFDGLASRYDTERGGFFGPTSDLLVQVAGLRPGQRVLDVGCGAGACLFAAAGAVGPAGHVTGIDLAAGMLARAAVTAARLGLANVTVEAGDAEDPAYPPASFDAVLASNVMFLLAEPHHAARNYLRLLRPGGVFAFSWNVAEDPDWVPVIAAVDAYAADGGFGGFLHRPPFDAVATMEAMLRHSGYGDVSTRQEVAEVRYSGPDAWWAASWNQAPALFWAKIPEPDLRAARARAGALLGPLRAADGSLRRGLGFCYTRGTR